METPSWPCYAEMKRPGVLWRGCTSACVLISGVLEAFASDMDVISSVSPCILLLLLHRGDSCMIRLGPQKRMWNLSWNINMCLREWRSKLMVTKTLQVKLQTDCVMARNVSQAPPSSWQDGLAPLLLHLVIRKRLTCTQTESTAS
jgi:hypothetical protein